MTPLVTVAEVGWEVSDMEVEGEGKPEVVAIVIENKDKGAKETKVWGLEQHVLCQVGDNELEWLGKDLAWLMPLTPVVLLLDFDERAAGEEWQFQRELEAAREELVVAFLAWQEENNVGEGDWEEEGLVEVPNNNADLNA
ncbi:hypothetical protein J132_05413 [Termitomyces sp. J132]|nr:hypothetical protein J132_05413 [Termitomyces sp. J132]